MLTDPIFPVATPNTTEIVSYAFWPAADYIVQTGAILFDKGRDCVYLTPGTILAPEDQRGARKIMTFPRSSRDDGDNDLNALLLAPFIGVKVKACRLALPRLFKKYHIIPGSGDPRAETKARLALTTDPFLVTLHTWWDLVAETDAEARGRQAITYWYAGSFDSSAPLGDGTAVPIPEALEILKGNDPYARHALHLFSALGGAIRDDTESGSSDL